MSWHIAQLVQSKFNVDDICHASSNAYRQTVRNKRLCRIRLADIPDLVQHENSSTSATLAEWFISNKRQNLNQRVEDAYKHISASSAHAEHAAPCY
jgi:hypothetical protein